MFRKEEKNPPDIYDVIIVGGGPAGLTAGLYIARARARALLLESLSILTQAALTDRIENYPGFPEGIGGSEFIDRLKTQAVNCGLEIYSEAVKSLGEAEIGGRKVYRVFAKDKAYDALSVIIAAGASPKSVGVPGEEKFKGRGVSYCAVCDAPLYKNKEVVVIGGGDAAVEEALFLTKFVSKVTIVHRRDSLRAAKVLQERAFANEKMEFVWDSVVTEISGNQNVVSVRTMNTKTNKESDIPCSGVFVFIGFHPNTNFLAGVIELDENGYVLTDDHMRTSKEGVFACGDCRKKLLRQVVTACGDGAVAAISARAYVERLKHAHS